MKTNGYITSNVKPLKKFFFWELGMPAVEHVFIALCSLIIGFTVSQTVETSSPLLSSSQFTFAQPQSFLQLQPDWALPAIREVTFQFRTDRPHGLLFYHTSTSNITDFPPYEMYVMLENGKLKVIHAFRNDSPDETLAIGKGLNRDKWHHVVLRINPGTAHLSVWVDEHERTVSLPSLSHYPNYNLIDTSPETVMYFGALDPNNSAINTKYNYVRFTGCLGNIMFSQLGNSLTPTSVVLDNQLYHSYIDLCKKTNPCLYKSECINHYTHTSCDCFGTNHEDDVCFQSHITTVTLRGYSYITYRVYDWRDRVHSEVMRLSITFRTFFENSVLLYAPGKLGYKNYVAISLHKGQLYIEIDFGDGPLNCTIGESLNDEFWHTLTIWHKSRNVSLHLDTRWREELYASDSHHHLYLDPEMFIGAAPSGAHGLKSREKFIGCLKNVYFNDKSVLYALSSSDDTARYHSIFGVEYGCDITNVIPMTFPLPESKLVLKIRSSQRLKLSLEFKTSQVNCVLASGGLKTEEGIGYWEIILHKGIALFVLSTGIDKETWSVTDAASGKTLADDQWHQVGVVYDSGDVSLEIDYRHTTTDTFEYTLEFLPEMIVTTSSINVERGFIGCMRDIYLSDEWIDPRNVVDTDQVSGKVSLDNCKLVNLCNNPYACEHGGRCFVEKGETNCDCIGTGYTGRTCHFSLHKRTCEELSLVGYRKNGVYKIDIDRNGPLPPAHVYCDMGDNSGVIVTRVENNMPQEMVVRKAGMKSFHIDITYREFTPSMLQSLVKHSKHCHQTVKYDCFRTPLGLRTYTWMKSSGTDNFITSIGSQTEACRCAETKTCANSSMHCNCDIGDARWRVDEGNYTHPKHLGITQIFILQPKGLEAQAEGRLTLGPLECVETDTQEYMITYKTLNSYIEVPGWRRGDIAFSFRTSNSQAVLIYQSSRYVTHGYLRVLLVNDHTLSFEYTVNEVPHSKQVVSRRKLNSGEWQQVWVDHDWYHMRFTVNLDSQMVDVGEAHGVGPFEGPLYVGGVPVADAGDSVIKDGFIGCFRGLVINDKVVDLYKHMTRSESAVVQGCRPSCASNPCQNGATCHEYWGSYVCECTNKYAHSGKNCELNTNTNGMTIISPKSYYHHKSEGSAIHSVLEKDILMSFRTFEIDGLLLYAFDHFNNFVQLHFRDKNVYFTFNSDRTINQISVDVPELSRGFPIQVKVDRHPQNTRLSVNGKESAMNITMKFVDKYFRKPWIQGEGLEIVFPPRGTYRTIDHSEMFLGHVGSGTETNFTKRGFVGCVQGLKIGNDIYDLDSAAKNMKQDEIYGSIRPGCKMLCDRTPCENQGLCIEHWANNMTSCDCSLTSYTGEICQKDIGGDFDGNSSLTYSFGNLAIDSGSAAVRFAFSTKVVTSQSLLLVQFMKSKYILIGITKDHSLFIEESIGSRTFKRLAKTKKNWSDGNRHWVYFSKNSAEVTFIVDGLQYSPFVQELDPELDIYHSSSNMIYVGGLPEKIESSEHLTNFNGCISNVMVELGDTKIMPLETAFGYVKGSLSKVNILGKVSEGKCADFAQLSQMLATLPSIAPPEIHSQEWFKEPPVMVPYESYYQEMSSTTLEDVLRTSNQVAAVAGVLLIIVLLGIAIYIYKIQRRHKRVKMGEDYDIYKGKRRAPSGNKVVSFSPNDKRDEEYSDVQPLTWVPTPTPFNSMPPPDFKRNSLKAPISNNVLLRPKHPVTVELSPLRATSSQELEWDPAGAQLTLEDMNTSESELREADDIEGPLPNLKSQMAPLATASEKRLQYRMDGRTGSVVFADEPYQ